MDYPPRTSYIIKEGVLITLCIHNEDKVLCLRINAVSFWVAKNIERRGRGEVLWPFWSQVAAGFSFTASSGTWNSCKHTLWPGLDNPKYKLVTVFMIHSTKAQELCFQPVPKAETRHYTRLRAHWRGSQNTSHRVLFPSPSFLSYTTSIPLYHFSGLSTSRPLNLKYGVRSKECQSSFVLLLFVCFVLLLFVCFVGTVGCRR